MFYDHFICDIEHISEGSASLRWCPICKHDQGFGGKNDLNRHFQTHHSIAAKCYVCDGRKNKKKCNHRCNLPSQIINHAVHCCTEATYAIRHDVPHCLLDALADTMKLVGGQKGNVKHIFPPGFPRTILKHVMPARNDVI